MAVPGIRKTTEFQRQITTDLCSPDLNRVEDKIWQLIFSHLETPQHMRQLGQVNHKLYQIFLDHSPWRTLLKKHFPHNYLSQPQNNNNKKDYTIYKQLTIMEQNIRAGEYTFQTLSGHRGSVKQILPCENKLFSCSKDSTIKIWDMGSGRELATLIGHQGPVNQILINRKKLISCSDDFTIKIWNIDNGKELRTLSGHEGPINQILIDEKNQLVSCSKDSTIKIWDIESGKELSTLRGHQGPVNQILTWETLLISSSDDSTIKIWDHKTNIVQTLHRNNSRTRLFINRDRLFACSHPIGTIAILDLKELEYIRYPEIKRCEIYEDKIKLHQNSGNFSFKQDSKKLFQMLSGHPRFDHCALDGDTLILDQWYSSAIKICDLEGNVQLSLNGHVNSFSHTIIEDMNKLIISCSKDFTINIWDPKNPSAPKTLKSHGGPVNQIVLYGDKIISCSDDGTIKFWNFGQSLQCPEFESLQYPELDGGLYTDAIAHKLVENLPKPIATITTRAF